MEAVRVSGKNINSMLKISTQPLNLNQRISKKTKIACPSITPPFFKNYSTAV